MAYLIVKMGKNIRLKDFLDISKLDKQVYKKEYQVNFLKGFFWIHKCYNGYIVVFDKLTNKVIAYANMLSLKKEYYEKLKNGEIIDASLPIKAQNNFSKKILHTFYFSSVVISPEYQNTQVITYLFSGVFKNLTRLAQKGIFGKSILVDAVSLGGEHLSETFGMDFISKTPHGSKIYEISLSPEKIKTFFESGKNLKEIYSHHFNKN